MKRGFKIVQRRVRLYKKLCNQNLVFKKDVGQAFGLGVDDFALKIKNVLLRPNFWLNIRTKVLTTKIKIWAVWKVTTDCLREGVVTTFLHMGVKKTF